MPEFRRDDWDAKKRKSRESQSEGDSTDSDWVSSSASAPKSKKRKSEHHWTFGGSDEVGDSDDLKLLGKELFEQTTSSGIVKRKIQHSFQQRVIESNNVAFNGEENSVKGLEVKREVNGSLYAKDEQWAGREAAKSTVISLNTTRTCMEGLIGELREARTRMLQWMRQEMHNMLHEGSGSPRVRTSSTGQKRGELELEDHSSQFGGMTASNLSNGLVGLQFGVQGGGSSGLGFAGHSLDGGGRVGFEGCDNNSAGGESSFGMQNSGNVRDEVTISMRSAGSNQVMGMPLAGQESAHGDARFGACNGGMSFGDHSRELGVALDDCRVGVPGGYGRPNGGDGGSVFPIRSDNVRQNGGDGGGSGFPNPSDNVRQNGQDAGIGFHIQSGSCGDLGFGAHTGSSGGLGYGGQSNGGESLMIFGGQTGARGMGELRSSIGLGNTNTSSSGVGNHQGSSLRISEEDKTPDLMGLHNQGAAVGMQNPVALNSVWNMMQQSGRSGSHGVSDSRVPNFNYDVNAKLINGGGTYGTLVGNSLGFENSAGMMRSAALQNGNAALGMQLPFSMRSASPSLNSSGMPMLIGMQNQVAMQSPSNLQNFLGLSMNGLNVGAAMNRQVFPGAYLQDNARQSLASGKVALMSTSPSVNPTTHKRGNGMQGLDILELNN